MSDQKLQEAKNKQQVEQKAIGVEIIFYTDPLCCWSWALEPQWRKLQYEHLNKIRWRYCMGGLISDWKNYTDTINSISRPFQMGPLWKEAHHISGMPVQDLIWMKDPPISSYPACVAVKCAGLQSSTAEEKYLRLAREAIMLKGLNIAKQKVLFDIAEELCDNEPAFDKGQFIEDFTTGPGIEAFKKDLQEVRFKNIGRFPTLSISAGSKRGVMVTGYHPYTDLLNAIKQIDPTLTPSQNINPEEYKKYFGKITDREAEEALIPLDKH